jgi:outer membrane protein, multidrug efflux system
MKSEIRNPKSERSPKSEIRIGGLGSVSHLRFVGACAIEASTLDVVPSSTLRAAQAARTTVERQIGPLNSRRTSVSGLRLWDFLRISDFGFRISSTASLATGLSLALLAVLGGCAVGPDYKRPALDTPAGYRTASTGPAATPGTNTFADLTWWEVFQDPQLTAYLREALTNNWDIQVAAARVMQAEGVARVTRSQFMPTVGAGGDWSTTRTSEHGPSPIPSGMNPQQEYGNVYGTMAAYEIDLWGKIRRANQAARARLLATVDAQEVVRQTLVAQVATAYLELLELDYELEIAQRTYGVRTNSLTLTTAREEGGVAAMQDVAQAKILVYSAEASIVAIQRLREQQENALCILLGRNPGSIQRGPGFTAQQVRAEVPAGLPSSLIERRPDLRAAEQQLVAANADIGQAKAAFYPQVTLTGFYGFQSVALSDLFTGAAQAWKFGPAVSMPLFTGGALRGNLQVAQGQFQEVLALYQKSVQNAFREVSDSLIAYQRSQEYRARQEENTQAHRTATDLANVRYEGGVTSYLEVLYNEQELFTSELNLSQARLAELLSVVGLYRSLGGGWQTGNALAQK